MYAKHVFSLLIILLIVIALPFESSVFAAQEWTPLLDKNLSQWRMYLSYRHKQGYDGKVPKNEKGESIPPIGYDKNINNVFTVIEENKHLVLKVTGEIYGCVFTRQDFENYHLKLQVKWGDKKWEPRTKLLKDAGVLYHSIGENGAEYWRSWMLSQEFQIMEGHMGDYWSQATSAIDIRAFLPEGNLMNSVASVKQPFLAFGVGSGRGGFCLRSEDRESPHGEWTELELICFEDKSLHIVNGHVVMVLRNSRYMDNGNVKPLTKGKIQLQSEAAEVYYKDVKIKSIKALPKEYAVYFR
jgi:hypothetical protein